MTINETSFNDAMTQASAAAWDRKWEQAAAAYREALHVIPDHPRALSGLGMALFELQQQDEALQAIRRAIHVSPSDPILLEKAARLFQQAGSRHEAISTWMSSAELYIKEQDTGKAIADWVNVTRLEPEHTTAHSYLAMVHERLGNKAQACAEFLAVASLFQRSGDLARAAQMVERALKLQPASPEARQAQSLLKNGQLLPRPVQQARGGTDKLRTPQVTLQEHPEVIEADLDPIAEADKRALSHLAGLPFELGNGEGRTMIPRRGMQAIVHGTGQVEKRGEDRSRIIYFISQAIENQAAGQEKQAADELEKALTAGFSDPALAYELGYLRSRTGSPEQAITALQQAAQHPDYELAAHLLMASVQRKAGRLAESCRDYLESLKIADAMVVPAGEKEGLMQAYEPFIEAQSQGMETAELEQIAANVENLLCQPGWKTVMQQARAQLPDPGEGNPPVPLAEILVQVRSSQVLELLGRVRTLAKAGHLRSAMEEAFSALQAAPTYLPLHILIGELLLQEGNLQDAAAKFTVVADAYSSRGDSVQAIAMLKRIVQVTPMDMGARAALVDRMVSRGMVDEAVGEYMDMGDIYYRMAELDSARKIYTTALRLVQQGDTRSAWTTKLLGRMADIDMQKLDWRQALRLFEQMRSLEPDDFQVRRNMIDLNIRLNQVPLAAVELEGFLSHLQSLNRREEATPFLESVVAEHPRLDFLQQALAQEYFHAGQPAKAVSQLDAFGKMLLDSGDRAGAARVVESILAFEPPNREAYTALLARLRPAA